MSLDLTDLRARDVFELAERMRPDEIDQFLALTGMDDYRPEVFARAVLTLRGPSYTLIDRAGDAVLCGGFEPVTPGFYRPWLIGTLDGWARHGYAITRHCRRQVDALLDGPARRLEIFALPSRLGALAWYERGLGMRYEGAHAAWFADGRDAVCYARTRKH